MAKPTSQQYWSVATGELWFADDGFGNMGQRDAQKLNDDQVERTIEAWALWEDVSGFKAFKVDDNRDLARDLGNGEGWQPLDWTRIATADLAGHYDPTNQTLGENNSFDEGYNGYREIAIQYDLDGAETFEPGTTAFSVLVHEVGHSVVGDHIAGSPTRSLMNAGLDTTSRMPATPMTDDIDKAIELHGLNTSTRTGNDTYGFNASFSGPSRAALNFDVNTQPLITIYDNGGTDTLDASGFDRAVRIELNPGGISSMLHGRQEAFAVIYGGKNEAVWAWIEEAVGGSKNDKIFGNKLDNKLYGNDGDDHLNGWGGGDEMYGGTGNDTYVVDQDGDWVIDEASPEGGTDKIFTSRNIYDLNEWNKGLWVEDLQFTGVGNFEAHGNDLDNWLIGKGHADWLYGGDGNDHLAGEGGADHMEGGRDDDEYFVDNVGDQVIEVANMQWVWRFGAQRYSAVGGVDTVRVDSDALSASGRDHYDLGDYVEHASVLGNSSFDLNGNGLQNELHGNDRANTLNGGGAGDRLYGFGGQDTLIGGDGDDGLDGGAGADEMRGGRDNDTYHVDDIGDKVVEDPNTLTMDADDGSTVTWLVGGNDTVRVDTDALASAEHYDYALGDYVENGALDGFSDFDLTGNVLDNVLHGNDWNNKISGLDGEDQIYGFGGSDTLYGGDKNDTLYGGSEDDELWGNGGNDQLNGEAGGDEMHGGTGDDIYYVDSIGDQTLERAGAAEGNDTVYSSLYAYTLDDNVENLGLLAGAKIGIGNALANTLVANGEGSTLRGSGGDDKLYAGGGADTLSGGRDSDTYYNVGAGDRVVENPNEGIDTIVTGLNKYTIDGNVENLTVDAFPFESYEITGNALNNVIKADTDVYQFVTYHFIGGDGHDTLIGGMGINGPGLPGDTLDGGAGNDTLDGGGNRDTLIGGVGNDTLTGGADGDTFLFASGWGKDTVTDFTRGSDSLDMTGVTGLFNKGQLTIADSAKGAVITVGNNSASSITLTGVTAAQLTDADFTFAATPAQPAGQTFDGTKSWGGTITGTANVDTVNYASATHAVLVDLNRDGGYARALTGAQPTEKLVSIENVTGSSTAMNYLHGNAADNILIGGSGIDSFTGRGGNNTLDGKGGVDTADYLETLASVKVDLVAGKAYHSTGVDTLIGIEQFRGSNFADTFIGDAADNYFNGVAGNDIASGNGGKDWLEGYDGNDTLNGGIGIDKLVGGYGDDTLTGGTDADTFLFRTGETGRDRITDFNFAEGDRISFGEHTGVNQYSHLAIANDGGNALVSFGTASFVLEGVAANQVGAQWFVW